MNDKITFPRLASMLADKSGRSKRFSEDFLREFFALISEKLEEGESVKVKGFGTFRLSRVEPRKSVDVTTGQPMEISGHSKVVFVPSKELAEAVNAPFEAFTAIEISDDTDLDKLFPQEEVIEQGSSEGLLAEEDFEEGIPEPHDSDDSGEAADNVISFLRTDYGLDFIDSDTLPSDDIQKDSDNAVASSPDSDDLNIEEYSIDMPDIEESPELKPDDVSAASFTIVLPQEKASNEIAEASPKLDTPTASGPEAIPLTIQTAYTSRPDAQPPTENAYESNESADAESMAEEDMAPEIVKSVEETSDSGESRRKTWGRILIISLGAAIGVLAAMTTIWYVFFAPDSDRLLHRTASASSPQSKGTKDADATIAIAAIKSDAAIAQPSDSTSETETADVPTAPSDQLVYDTISTTRYLTTMAKSHYGNYNLWPYIYEENKAKLGHPDRIRPGTPIVIPKLSKYGVDPTNTADVEKAKQMGVEIYARYGKKI